ncbi:6-phosphogluconate dehydrogenase C-terminal domain-like protein [Hypoxylon fragiforme]|uniref:6-phosphogluconate dehydrogenase C-terminal domain-like protein n=1 Tax=Hypoxylon fragiforme TaxID=63214 RepID=UPI0020C726D4|nr:6-phosphogluconate dehydrogenase C-terminal domain-like protein [Hypoxylon fragiforme]KAI2607565.1 6-phosphogluconate dehydrogenase C-terminal domain-like protein [Hypoxylon fragiforme]
MASPTPRIGILSIGDMGMGIAKLLVAHGFAVATNCKGRSADTLERAQSAQVEVLSSDEELAQSCAVILSVVPPRDAEATAQRIADALTGPLRRPEGHEPLYFVDLNAVAPSTVKRIAALFDGTGSRGPSARFVDGCILGGPPSLLPSPNPTTTTTTTSEQWKLPSIPTSGPHPLSSIPLFGAKLATVLNTRHLNAVVGSASGLKMCFASLSKGYTALALQAVTTAHRLSILPELESSLRTIMPPAYYDNAVRGVTAMPPKAYRWVAEMEEIARTLSEEGGFSEDNSFRGAAEAFRIVAQDTVLGGEKIGRRERGTTVEDVARAMAEGMEGRRKKDE